MWKILVMQSHHAVIKRKGERVSTIHHGCGYGAFVFACDALIGLNTDPLRSLSVTAR